MINQSSRQIIDRKETIPDYIMANIFQNYGTVTLYYW
jgi:hypothetical protein